MMYARSNMIDEENHRREMEQMKKEYADYKINPYVNNAFMTKRMNIPKGSKDIEITSWENILKTNRERRRCQS